jgi:hypothetical protein
VKIGEKLAIPLAALGLGKGSPEVVEIRSPFERNYDKRESHVVALKAGEASLAFVILGRPLGELMRQWWLSIEQLIMLQRPRKFLDSHGCPKSEQCVLAVETKPTGRQS